jgi:hypothetical protein
MGKSGWDVDQILLPGGEADTGPLAKMRRAHADVDSDIQSFALDNATELGLRMAQLVVEAAKRSAGGRGVIVLKESVVDTEVCEFDLVVGLEEGAACVAIDYRTQLIDTWQGGFDSFHLEEYYARWF